MCYVKTKWLYHNKMCIYPSKIFRDCGTEIVVYIVHKTAIKAKRIFTMILQSFFQAAYFSFFHRKIE